MRAHNPLIDAVVDLTRDGLTAMQIRGILGVTASHVHVLRRQARELYGRDCMDRD